MWPRGARRLYKKTVREVLMTPLGRDINKKGISPDVIEGLDGLKGRR